MTSPSLTFAMRSPLRAASIHARLSVAQAAGCRRFASDKVNTEEYEGKTEHATNKKGLDIQSEQANKARSANDEGGADNATAERDSQNSTAKAKKDHPEAPDVVIGMQDERGAKGA